MEGAASRREDGHGSRTLALLDDLIAGDEDRAQQRAAQPARQPGRRLPVDSELAEEAAALVTKHLLEQRRRERGLDLLVVEGVPTCHVA